MSTRFKIALVQMFVGKLKSNNVARAEKLIREASTNGAKVVVLPEYFSCLMDPAEVHASREILGGPTTRMLSRAAKENNVYVFGGTIAEEMPNSDRLYSTCPIFNPTGQLAGVFRKLHMFNVDMGPGLSIQESSFNRPGPGLVVVPTDYCKVGFGVCMDLRFPELSALYTRRGCKLLTFVGGFSLNKTGPAHWELLTKARAVDNQVFVANVEPARNDDAPYVTYGHSCVADPWGDIIASADFDEQIVYADIDLGRVDEVRRHMPLADLRRHDLYDLRDLKTGPKSS